jgi:hypothetical protein
MVAALRVTLLVAYQIYAAEQTSFFSLELTLAFFQNELYLSRHCLP